MDANGSDGQTMSSTNKVYYENCEGCKVDARKDKHKGVPFKELFFIWVVCLASSLPISCLFPFLYFMIKDFHIAKKEEDIGFYAGFVGSAYMFGRAMTSILWGMIADRYGRKPVIIIGTLAVVVMNALFGLSTKFWMAISTRFILGLLCGLLGPIKVIFSAKCAIVVFPYLLPCLCISFCAALAFIVCWWLPETLHTHSGTNEEKNVKDRNENLLETGTIRSDSKRSPFKNWPLMSSIIVYSVFSLHDMAYSEIFSLWAVSPKKFGGLSFSTKNVGLVLSITGCGLIISQQILYPMVERIFGHMKITRIASVLTVPLLTSYPFIAKLSGLSLSLVLNCASILKNAFSNAILTGLFIIQNNAVPQHQRGAANGIAMTSMSLFKAFGPAGGGCVNIFSWTLKRMDASFLPGVHMVFFILNVIELIGLLSTCRAFLPFSNSKGYETECFQNERGSK
ncbi:hypothetical protein MKX03_017756 [Papaver bracteatum]|nr:hypothetical protein MKX03_017756 [Papaver bracteatum]